MKQITERRENYLKRIHELSKTGEVRGADLATELNVKRPTVCVYLKRLVEYGDITMDDLHTVHLTDQGRKIAEATLDRHGMICSLLKILGVPSEVAAEDACAIEHNISPETYSALNQLLNERQVSI